MPASTSGPGPAVVRDRRADDLEAIVDLALESIGWHADTFRDIRSAPARDSLLTDYQQLGDSPETYFRVAELQGAVVGFLLARLHPPPTDGIEKLDGPSIYIADVAVTAAARRQGIGRALLQDLESWAADHDAHAIRLNMHAGNTPAQHLYESLGYRQTWVTYRKDTG